MKIALLLTLAAINLSYSKALADSRESPIKVATITYIESLNKEREIGIDHINLVQDLTLLSFARNSIQHYSGDNAKIEYATVWNRSTLIFCPANFDSWENCNTNIITTIRRLLTQFDKNY